MTLFGLIVVVVFVVSFVALACLLLCLLRLSLRVVVVQGQSMEPTLASEDHVLVWRFWPKRWLRRGQVVLVCPWGNPEEDYIRFLKRIVGMPGDTLVTHLDELPEDMQALHAAFYDAQQRRIWQVPPGHVFVRGDNRRGSIDSASWGAVPMERVYGIMLRKLSPTHTSQSSQSSQSSQRRQTSHLSSEAV